MSTGPRRSEVAIILELGRSLHAYGTPAGRMESTLELAAKRLDLEVQVFSTVTGLIVAFGTGAEMHTVMMRLEPGDLDLGKLARVDAAVHAFLAGETGPEWLHAELVATREEQNAPSSLKLLTSRGIGAAAGAFLLGGGLREAGAAAVTGTLIAALASYTQQEGRRFYEFSALAAIIAGASSVLCSAAFGPLSLRIATAAALLPLLPGLPLITGMEEVAAKDLLAGTSRLMSAALTFFQLVFGVALGSRVSALVHERNSGDVAEHGPLWFQCLWVALSLGVIAVQFRVARRDLPWMFAAGIVGYASARLGGALFGIELGAFVAALIIGAFGNAVARWFRRPALLTVVPGMFALWPGSLGFQTVQALWSERPLAGLGTAFSVAMIGVGAATGVLVADTVLSPRRPL